MSEPAISVIVPVRDLRNFIGEALASIQAQSRPVQEVLVIDDGSRDGTAELLRDMAARDSRLRLLSGEGRGAPAARNIGLRAARGDIIAFLDGDDIWPKDMIGRQLERLAAHDRPDIVSGLVQRFRIFDASEFHLVPLDTLIAIDSRKSGLDVAIFCRLTGNLKKR